MGAHPKQRISRGRKGNRRRHDWLKLPQLTSCQMCGEKRRNHHVCPSCGTYKGRQVLQISGPETRRSRQEEQ